MPSWIDVEDAAKNLASYLTPRCSVEKFESWVQGAAERPENYGFPRSYSRRPNWDVSTLRKEVSWVLWRTASHPAKGGLEYRGLPKRELGIIASGNIRYLWDGAGVSSKLRHEWLTACAVNRLYKGEEWRVWIKHPLTWVCRHAPVHANGFVPRSLLVASWLEAKKEWKGWHTQIPVGYGADGEMSYINPVVMLDEVWDTDLTQGIKSSPERVFRAVVARTNVEALERLARERAPFPVMPWPSIDGITQIMTAADLVAEGARMRHCVGGYVHACRGGQCFIVRLRSSTAELSADGYVRQHRGFRNETPPEADINLLDRWVHEVVDPKQRELRRIREEKEAEEARILSETNRRLSQEGDARAQEVVLQRLKGVTRMERCSLYHIEGLVHLDIPDSVTTLDEDAIIECYQLETIRLPAGAVIESIFFRSLPRLEKIYCSEEQVPALREVLDLEERRSIYFRCPNTIEICII